MNWINTGDLIINVADVREFRHISGSVDLTLRSDPVNTWKRLYEGKKHDEFWEWLQIQLSGLIPHEIIDVAKFFEKIEGDE